MNVSFLAHIALVLMQHLGYAGLALALLLNTLGIPFSSEVLLPAAGLAARQGSLNLALVIVVAIAAQLVGAALSHWIGTRYGRAFVHRYGRYVLLSDRDLKLAERWFARYGRVAEVVGYCLPFVRGYVGYVAGFAGVPRTRLLLGAGAGIVVWTVALVLAGHTAGAHLATIERVAGPISYAFVALVVVVLGYGVIKRLQGQRPA